MISKPWSYLETQITLYFSEAHSSKEVAVSLAITTGIEFDDRPFSEDSSFRGHATIITSRLDFTTGRNVSRS
jgi:hypothetical protein